VVNGGPTGEGPTGEGPGALVHRRIAKGAGALLERARAALATVVDPELPFVTVEQLGIVREVREVVGLDGDAVVEVVVTPTFSGCPATEMILADIADALDRAGCRPAVVRQRLRPRWTTAWLTPEGREALARAGIAPPGPTSSPGGDGQVACPHCGATQSEVLSSFGPSACLALRRCSHCREPFEAMKAV
jgi:ring-1,2-phenylacetyl-CoA epoxidase subunit PaaD